MEKVCAQRLWDSLDVETGGSKTQPGPRPKQASAMIILVIKTVGNLRGTWILHGNIVAYLRGSEAGFFLLHCGH